MIQRELDDRFYPRFDWYFAHAGDARIASTDLAGPSAVRTCGKFDPEFGLNDPIPRGDQHIRYRFGLPTLGYSAVRSDG